MCNHFRVVDLIIMWGYFTECTLVVLCVLLAWTITWVVCAIISGKINCWMSVTCLHIGVHSLVGKVAFNLFAHLCTMHTVHSMAGEVAVGIFPADTVQVSEIWFPMFAACFGAFSKEISLTVWTIFDLCTLTLTVFNYIWQCELCLTFTRWQKSCNQWTWQHWLQPIFVSGHFTPSSSFHVLLYFQETLGLSLSTHQVN